MNTNENDVKKDYQEENEQQDQPEEETANPTTVNDSLAEDSVLNDELTSEEEQRIAQLEANLKEVNDKYLRLVAEFDNFRKRTARERIELTKSAGEDIIKSLLDVLDDTDRATQQLEHSEDIEANTEGVTLVFNKLKKVLQSKGLKEMETKGHDFDAELHEAITEIPAPSEDLKYKVVDEVLKGYYLHDKIIRHAKVVVGK